jgi:membrane-bound metal-dependent hydrolase YbcI (DUF457 family)
MFLGHVAVGMAAKRQAPRVSLAILVLAAQLADVIWPVLVGLGVERVTIEPGNTRVTPLNFISYPYSHSLFTLALWSMALAFVFGLSRGRRAVAVLAVLVVSHWLLDVITHRPDMPLIPQSRLRLGFGLWNSIPATMAVELTMYAAGVWIYMRSTRARDRIGSWGFGVLVAFLAAVYLVNVFGPPPPSVTAIWIGALIGAAVMSWWAWWVDQHRTGG